MRSAEGGEHRRWNSEKHVKIESFRPLSRKLSVKIGHILERMPLVLIENRIYREYAEGL